MASWYTLFDIISRAVWTLAYKGYSSQKIAGKKTVLYSVCTHDSNSSELLGNTFYVHTYIYIYIYIYILREGERESECLFICIHIWIKTTKMMINWLFLVTWKILMWLSNTKAYNNITNQKHFCFVLFCVLNARTVLGMAY